MLQGMRLASCWCAEAGTTPPLPPGRIGPYLAWFEGLPMEYLQLQPAQICNTFAPLQTSAPLQAAGDLPPGERGVGDDRHSSAGQRADVHPHHRRHHPPAGGGLQGRGRHP